MRLTICTETRWELIPELDRLSIHNGYEKNEHRHPIELRAYTKGGRSIKIIYSNNSVLTGIFFAIRNAIDKGAKGYAVSCDDLEVEETYSVGEVTDMQFKYKNQNIEELIKKTWKNKKYQKMMLTGEYLIPIDNIVSFGRTIEEKKTILQNLQRLTYTARVAGFLEGFEEGAGFKEK